MAVFSDSLLTFLNPQMEDSDQFAGVAKMNPTRLIRNIQKKAPIWPAFAVALATDEVTHPSTAISKTVA